MSYQVIARKYRPQRFSDVVGQEHVTQTLSRAIEQNRIAHAYLFCGPRGTGKTTIARIFAKCLNCTNGPRVEFDDADPRCREIAEGRSLDVLEIDAASNRGIDEIRGLRETVRYAPASSKFKVYIIDEVHMLTKEAFNALLKTLEEPPEHVKFMFATTEPEKVLATILSRCQRFDLRRIPLALIVKHLRHIAAQEKVTVDEAALFAIARGAEGGMRDAESTLDQLISFCGDRVEEADVLSMFGLTAQAQLMELTRGLLAGEVETTLRQLNQLTSAGKDLGRLVSDLLNHFRNLLIYQVSKGDLAMLEVSEAETAALAVQTKLVSTEGLTRILEILGETELRLRDAASRKILLEVGLLRAIEMRQALSIDSVLKQLQDLRSRSGTLATSNTPASVVPVPSQKLALPAVNQETVEPAPSVRSGESPGTVSSAPGATLASQQTGTVADLAGLWTSLVDAAGRASPFIRSYLREAHPVSFNRKVFVIGFDPEFEDHIGLVDNARNHTLLQTKLGELGHPGVQIKFVKAEAPTGWKQASAGEPVGSSPASAPPPPPVVEKPAGSGGANRAPAPNRNTGSPPAPLNKDEFKNDPLIQKALDVFKGTVVDVRL